MSIKRALRAHAQDEICVTTITAGVAMVSVTHAVTRVLLRTLCITPTDLEGGVLSPGYIHVKSTGKVVHYDPYSHCTPAATH
jgi:hypothetical protein